MKINFKTVFVMSFLTFGLFTSCEPDNSEITFVDNVEVVSEQEKFIDITKSCVWHVKSSRTNNIDPSAIVLSEMKFRFGSTLIYTSPQAIAIGIGEPGSWNAEETDSGLQITIDIDNANFDGVWEVTNLEDDKIELTQGDALTMVLEKDCDFNLDYSTKTFKFFELAMNDWTIDSLEISDTSATGLNSPQSYSNAYATSELKFGINTVKFRLNNSGFFQNGTYEFIAKDLIIFLKISLPGRPELELEWFIHSVGPNSIKLHLDTNLPLVENEMVLKKRVISNN